jgi:hypothetical protein
MIIIIISLFIIISFSLSIILFLNNINKKSNSPSVPPGNSPSVPPGKSPCSPPIINPGKLSDICKQAYQAVNNDTDYNTAGEKLYNKYPSKYNIDPNFHYSCENPKINIDNYNPNPKSDIPGVTDTTNLAIKRGNIENGNCCGWLPHFNWVISTCNTKSNNPPNPIGQFCGYSSGGKLLNMNETCTNESVKINYVAAYQYDGCKWHLINNSSCGDIDENGIKGNFNDNSGFNNNKENFKWNYGDWTTKYAPCAKNKNGKHKDSPRGLSPPGCMFVLSAENFYYGGFYMLTQTAINTEYRNLFDDDNNEISKSGKKMIGCGKDIHENRIACPSCWTWELDPVEGTGGWSGNNTFIRNINDLYFTVTAQTSGNMPMPYNNEKIKNYKFPKYFNWEKSGEFDPYNTDNINKINWGGGAYSSKYFSQKWNQPYVFIVIIDSKGYWTYRFIPDSDGKIPWNGIEQYQASKHPDKSPNKPINNLNGLKTAVDESVKEAVMLTPAVNSDYSCGQALIRSGNIDWAFESNLIGSLLWQNKGTENKLGNYNLWEYYKDTNQYKDYSPSIMGVITPKYDNPPDESKHEKQNVTCQ